MLNILIPLSARVVFILSQNYNLCEVRPLGANELSHYKINYDTIGTWKYFYYS